MNLYSLFISLRTLLHVSQQIKTQFRIFDTGASIAITHISEAFVKPPLSLYGLSFLVGMADGSDKALEKSLGFLFAVIIPRFKWLLIDHIFLQVKQGYSVLSPISTRKLYFREL